MDFSRRILALAAGIAGILVAAALMPAAVFGYPVPFGSHPHPISVSYNGQYLLATGGNAPATECSDGITAYDASGNSFSFATLRSQPGCIGSQLENYMVTVPADQPYWPAGMTYVARGAHVYALAPDGSWTHFVEGPCTDDDIPGITLDTTGNFFYLMFVTCARSGKIWYIDNAGVPRLFASVYPNFIEGPAIAPANFPTLGKTLMVTDEVSGRIYAFPLEGGMSMITGLSSPEDIDFIPPKLCTFGDGNGALYSAIPPSQGISYRRPADFAGLSGAFIGGENGGNWIMSSPDRVTRFQGNFEGGRTYEGSAFMTYGPGCGVYGSPGTTGAATNAKTTTSAFSYAKSTGTFPRLAMPRIVNHRIPGFRPFILRRSYIPRARIHKVGPKRKGPKPVGR